MSIFNTHKRILNTTCTQNANTLTQLRPGRILMGKLNMYSLRNKLEYITEIIRENMDTFLVSKKTLDSSFPHG